MFKRLRNDIICLVVLASAGAAFYYLVLNDEARASVKKTIGVVGNSYSRVSGAIDGITGIVMEEDQPFLPNRESVIAQWRNLGF